MNRLPLPTPGSFIKWSNKFEDNDGWFLDKAYASLTMDEQDRKLYVAPYLKRHSCTNCGRKAVVVEPMVTELGSGEKYKPQRCLYCGDFTKLISYEERVEVF